MWKPSQLTKFIANEYKPPSKPIESESPEQSKELVEEPFKRDIRLPDIPDMCVCFKYDSQLMYDQSYWVTENGKSVHLV